jgi:hypothetical protein
VRSVSAYYPIFSNFVFGYTAGLELKFGMIVDHTVCTRLLRECELILDTAASSANRTNLPLDRLNTFTPGEHIPNISTRRRVATCRWSVGVLRIEIIVLYYQ